MNFEMNRRGFVRTVASVAVATGIGLSQASTANASATTDDRDHYYRGPFKVACNAYCFNKIMLQQLKGGPDDMDLMKLLDYCADPAHRFDSLDATGYYFPPGNFQGQPFTMPAKSYLRAFKRKADDLGVPITGTGIHNDFASPDPASRAADVENFRRWIDVAKAIGAPVIRVFAGPVPAGYENNWSVVAAWMVDSLRQCADYAEDAGVKVCLQNHGDMIATTEQFIKVLGMVDNPRGIGADDDTGYFLDKKPDGTPDWYGAIGRMLPYSINAQVKTYLVEVKNTTPTPNEKTDPTKLMRIFRESPYRKPIPIETLEEFGVPYDPFTVVPQFLHQVRTALDETAEHRFG
ncbi:MAG TPA: sugar phosphate isomerase/epimerase family protein [Pseudonocardiaceae bacterium]